MADHSATKRPDALKKATKRPKTLGALVAAVGASALGLLGPLPSASADVNTGTSTLPKNEATVRLNAKAKLRLNRVGSKIELAGGGGHASHESHASHASHSSGDYR